MLRAKSRYPQLCSDPVSMATDVMDSLHQHTTVLSVRDMQVSGYIDQPDS